MLEPCRGTLPTFSLIALVTALLLAVGCDWPVSVPQATDTIRLRTRVIDIPPERLSKDFVDALKKSPEKRLHAITALTRPARLKDKQRLEATGLSLLFPIHPTVWASTVTDEFVKHTGSGDIVRWIGLIEAGDKIEPAFQDGNLPSWVRDESGRLKVIVEMFPDIPNSRAEAIIGSFATSFQSMPGTGLSYIARLPAGKLEALAAQDAVKAIEPGPVPFQPALNFSRSVTRAEVAQNADTSVDPPLYNGLSGQGVQIGIFDSGIDHAHDDFNVFDAGGTLLRSRILGGPGDPDGHGTNVAGVASGSGRRSVDCGASAAYFYRGMAPEADLISVRPDASLGSIGDVALTITTYGLDISNHSYDQVLNGTYSAQAADIDALIRGDYVTSAGRVPARPMVWSAGNHGIVPQYGINEGYFAIAAPAKNAIVVGATIADTAGAIDRILNDSSLGPTFDGRIKPDLMAPGSGITTTAEGTNCYSALSGTSIAAPMVTGIGALVLEEYASVTGTDLDSAPPLPSTVKAIMIQTAEDLVHTVPDRHDWWDNPDTDAPVLYHAGPDYATGYGRVDAFAAIELVRSGRFVEGAVSDRAQTVEHCLGSTPTGSLQATLAWDDEPDEDRLGPRTDPNLINDLELRLVDPAGGTHLPWVLPPLTPAAVSGAPDPITPADILPAAPGEDHLNNIEQVTVTGAVEGVWRLTVSVAPGSVGLLEMPQPFSVAASGPIVKGCPDLVVTAFETTGPAVLRPVEGSERNSAHVPVRVTVENQGTGEAHPFKLAAFYRGVPSDPGRDFVAAFSVPGGADIWYPFRPDRLPAGESWTVEGEIVFVPSISGSTISISVGADSCAGDEFRPTFCRVPEFDETNNFSVRFDATLP